ncbi:MAG: hypothetical protein QNK40_06185 [Desulfobacterales bacterium]|nr:hypothetical protein [Desulfobacterales bacterium]
MKNLKQLIACVLVAALVLVVIGCGGKQDIVSQMTGTWKSDKSGYPVKINLTGNDKSIEINGKTVPVTVKNVDKGEYQVTVAATSLAGKTSEWSLIQVWDDNGSNFTIKFEHDGMVEPLVRMDE